MLVLVAALTFCVASEASHASVDLNQVPPSNIPFSVGEQIDFHVMFGLIPAGRARLAVVGMDTVNGQQTFHARLPLGACDRD